MYQGSPYAHHLPNTIIVKRGKKAWLIWDGTPKRFYWEITMNEATDIEQEAAITFIYTTMTFFT